MRNERRREAGRSGIRTRGTALGALAALSILLAPAIGAQGPSRRAVPARVHVRDSVSKKPAALARPDSEGHAPRADSLSVDSSRADSATVLLPQRPAEELSDMGIQHAGSVRFCYEREGLGRDPSLRANLDVTVTIAPDGLVRSVAVDTSGVSGQGARDVVSCVARAVAQWHYQAGSYGVESTTYTYNLSPAGKP